MENDHLYQYEAIPHPDYLEKTRVLTLAPGTQSDPLAGTLETLSTVDPAPFEALSYVWGRDPSRDNINVDGKTLTLTTSLAVALRRIRDAVHPRVIWIDQICINQQDLIERSQQVRHMNSIYQKASKVLVWLGEDKDVHADRAFALIQSLGVISQDPLLLRQFKDKQTNLDWFPSEYWVSLGELFKQPWFDRKWILQEIGTDAPSVLFWGQASLDWDHLAKAADLVKNYGYTLRRQYDLLIWKPWYMEGLFDPSSYKSKPLDFTYELHRARWQLASDPRDHVFALLGHPAAQEGPDGERVIEADYTKSVEDVYHQISVHMLRKGDSLMILNAVQHESVDSALQKHPLPTWVAQWDSQNGLHNILGDVFCVYHPSKDILPTPKFLESEKVLVLDGLSIDTISTTTKIMHTSDLTLNSSTIADIWKSQPECEDGTFSTAKKYHTGEPALLAFLETISAVKKRTQQAPIALSERLSDGTDFLVKAFGATHTLEDHIREMSVQGNCYNWMERASGGANGRRFARGQQGYYALCPPGAREGDQLCLLLGGKTLLCLRPDRDSYLFVGECYVHGVMDGEALDMLEKGDMTLTTFMIR